MVALIRYKEEKMKIKVRHILVQHQYEAEDLLRKLKEGHSFSELAKKFSLCSSSPQGGELGLVSLEKLDETFADALELLKKGEMSQPVRTRFGYHLLERLS